ncbi:hypothetical protein QA612_10800 [Evansella sp. AB-P1]|uniref:hypothetical protein n=1 Tax=Evansella sp. AB-P1 TaxID=3037653 RepID=UPI00241F118C|nr:hypothetical protein [Evansella sp. AB-P1]MDG5787977.1 hypothetical protein [Evansella sp. AB-P1]
MRRQHYYILFLVVTLLAACQSNSQEEALEEKQYDFIHEEFSYTPFLIPENWDVVAVGYDVKHQFIDWREPENHRYAQVPYRYTITFGKLSEENEVTEEDLREYNEQQSLIGHTNRQKLYHTYNEEFGSLEISKNGFTRLIINHEDTEEWKLGGEDFLVLNQESEWAVNWYNNGTYYDLLILSDANISNQEELEELLEYMFL